MWGELAAGWPWDRRDTTFSTFGYEMFELARDGDWMRAGANVLLQLSCCLVAVWGGFSLAKLW